jgi:phage tail-like protein
MRGAVDGLVTPHPLLDTMPGVYQADPIAENLCASCDEALAPIVTTLDCLTAYLDPHTTPADMLDWLAGWIGCPTVGSRDPARRRESILTGIALLPLRGTAAGVRAAVAAAVGTGTVEVIESGATTGSTTPGSAPGGRRLPVLVVRVTVDADARNPGGAVDYRMLDELVDAAKPAHLPHRVEVITRDGRGPAARASAG